MNLSTPTPNPSPQEPALGRAQARPGWGGERAASALTQRKSVLATHARPSFAGTNHKELLQSMIPSDLAGGGTGFRLDHARQTKKEAERRQARSPTSAPCGRGAPLRTSPQETHKREARRGAHRSAAHHGACGSDQTPPLSSSYALPGTELGRSGRYPPPAVPVQRVAPQTGHHAGRAYDPEPPGSGGDEPPPAGTALAPSAGVAGWRPLRKQDW